MTWRNLAPKTILILILILAAGLRLYGLNWDQNQHLHPDERFLTMVAGSLAWPHNFSEYLNTSISPLNPQNRGYNFYVYGTYPVWLVKYISEELGLADYSNLTLVGRAVSSVLDVGIVAMVFGIAKILFDDDTLALFASFMYATFVLAIQLSHFFAVDNYVTFFSTLSVYLGLLLLKKRLLAVRISLAVGLGIGVGMAAAAKISALLLVPLVVSMFVVLLFRIKFAKAILLGIVCLLTFCGTVRLAMPYLFVGQHLNPKVLANWRELKSYDNPEGYFPPATMWINAPDYIFPLQNMIFQGVGIVPSGLIAVGIFYIILRRPKHMAMVLLLWCLAYFAYQGGQFAKPMRYFYTLYPLLAIFGAVGGSLLVRKHRGLLALVVGAILLWPLAFEHIYTQPQTRVAASQWIYSHIPVGSSLTCEHWDDCLPQNLAKYPGNGAYKGIELPMFNLDSVEKWTLISNRLDQTDYIILSSSRVYGSTVSVPQRYPWNMQYYQALFSGELGFVKVAEFVSQPTLPFPPGCIKLPGNYGYLAVSPCSGVGLKFIDDYTDETFTVYDHPKVTIFKKVRPVDYLTLLEQKIALQPPVVQPDQK